MNESLVNETLQMLKSLRKYIGAEVLAASLVIWPRGTWPEDTDTMLQLRLSLVDDTVTNFTLGTDWNEQAPSFSNEEFPPKYSYDALPERIEAWDILDNPTDCNEAEAPSCSVEEEYIPIEREVFDLAGSFEYGWLIGSRLIAVEIVCMEENYLIGTLLYFDNGHRIWSSPGTDGNTIWPEFDRKYLADEWRFYKFRLDLDCRSVDDCT